MKLILTTIALLLSTLALGQTDFFNDFLVGKYIVVGKELNSDETYTGRVEIYLEKGALKIKRLIKNQVVLGRAMVEPVPGGGNKVLRFRYEKAGVAYEQTCLWQSDLDNYARISCYLYQPNVGTRTPGLEVLFYDHAPE